MNILPITHQDNRPLNFKRALTPREIPVYTETINKGLKVLDKQLGMIIHNSSVPSKASQNIGIGSLLSKTAEAFFVPFLKTHGFSSIQQEPNYLRDTVDPSPYSPVSTSKNTYMIPIERLSTMEYGKLLSDNEVKEIVVKKALEDRPNRVNYENVQQDFDNVLKIAHTRFVNRRDSEKWRFKPTDEQKEQLVNLAKDYAEFKKVKSQELEPNAIFEILTKKHKTHDWRTWTPQDRNLYDIENFSRLQIIKKEHAEEIDFHIFKQWILEREITKSNERNDQLGIKVFADTPIAFTPAETWLNKDLFLSDLSLGCPDGQRWGFAVLDPEKMFNEDGSLGKAGEFLKKKYEGIFQASPGGVRIDHIIGLVDPYVYSKKSKKMTNENSGRLYSSPNHALLGKYAKHSDEEYASVMEKIIIPAAEKFNIPKENIICEDLGWVTDPVKYTMDRFNLPGITVTQYDNTGADAPERNVIMPGSHDHQSFIEHTDNLFRWNNNRFNFKTHIAAADTKLPYEDEETYRNSLRKDKRKFITASFAELFTSPAKKVQVFFTDFFGIDKTYNVPGSKEGCWTLRLGEDFEELYYDNLSKGVGMNLPEAIARAIRHKGEDFSSQHQNLLKNLDTFAEVLKS